MRHDATARRGAIYFLRRLCTARDFSELGVTTIKRARVQSILNNSEKVVFYNISGIAESTFGASFSLQDGPRHISRVNSSSRGA